ncbi:MAG: HAD hydrolase-like protein [Desulfobacterales bacterium]
MGFKTILFDLDGTLTDPKTGIFNCIAYALGKMGRPVKGTDNWERYIGPPLLQSFAELLESDDLELARQALAHYRERFSQQGLFENRVYGGIEALLGQLKDRGSVLYVATSKPQVFARRIIAHFMLDVYFKAVYGSELDGTRAEKSALLAHLMHAEALVPQESLMIGDRKYDVWGAKSAGLAAAGVLWGYGSRQELETAGADWICDQPQELNAICHPEQ